MIIRYYLLLVYPAIIFLLLCFKAKLSHNNTFNESFLSLEQTKAFEATACLAVILHHLTQVVTGFGDEWKGPITIFANIGILFTSIFFFFSGYGLLTSYLNKENYLSDFLFHRLSKILIPFFISNIVLVIFKYLSFGHVGGFGKAIKYIFGFVLINGNGWYIIEITFLYLAFYFSFKYVKNKDFALVLLSIFTLYLMLYAKGKGHQLNTTDPNGSWFTGEWWYNSTIAFLFGLYFARFKDFFVSFFKKHYLPLILLFSALLVVTYNIEEYIRKVYGYYKYPTTVTILSYSTMTLIAQSVLCLIFIIWLLLVGLKVKFSNKALDFIGTISLELFLCHKLFVEDLSLEAKFKEPVYFLLVYLLSLALAIVLSQVNKLAYKGLTYIFEYITGAFFSKQPRAKGIKPQKLALTIIAISLISYAAFSTIRIFTASYEFKQELSSIENANIGDVVLYGRYDTSVRPGKERLHWIVVESNDDTCTLVCANGIDCDSYNVHYQATCWQNSSLRQRLNSDSFLNTFSSYERQHLASDNFGDYVSLLNSEEACLFFENDSDRILSITQMARINGANENSVSKMNKWDYRDQKASWWWLKSDSDSINAPVITVDGDISEQYVNLTIGSIRPVIRIKK